MEYSIRPRLFEGGVMIPNCEEMQKIIEEKGMTFDEATDYLAEEIRKDVDETVLNDVYLKLGVPK